MKRSTKWFLGAAIAVGTFGAGTGAVLASGGADEAEDGPRPRSPGLNSTKPLRRRWTTSARVGSVTPRWATRRATTRSRSPLTTAVKSTFTSMPNSPSSEPKPKGLMRSPAPTTESGP